MILKENIDRLIANCGITNSKQVKAIRDFLNEYDADFDKEIKSIQESVKNGVVVSHDPILNNPSFTFVMRIPLDDYPSPFIYHRLEKSFNRLLAKHTPNLVKIFSGNLQEIKK